VATPDGSGAFTAEDLARRAKSLRALARSLVRDDGAAEDLVQDTMVVALERPPRSSASLPGWLATVARRLALDRARGERRRIAREERAARDETTESPVRALESLELERQVLDAVLALREPYRTVVYLRYWEELHPAAIAERLGVPVKTVKSRLARALEELRARLDSSVAGGRERWMAGLAGGAWIVKKAVVAVVAAALLVVLAWRATRGAEEPELPPAAASAAIEAGASARPAVEPAGDLPERTAAAAAPRADAATRATGELLVKLLRHDGTPAVDVSMDFRCAGDPTPREEFLRRRTDPRRPRPLPRALRGDVIVDVDRGPRFEVQAVAASAARSSSVSPRACRSLAASSAPRASRSRTPRSGSRARAGSARARIASCGRPATGRSASTSSGAMPRSAPARAVSSRRTRSKLRRCLSACPGRARSRSSSEREAERSTAASPIASAGPSRARS
jgi:RNA polymerase sigma-70 factor (ECF subfamily)